WLMAVPVEGFVAGRRADFPPFPALSEPYLVISSRRALALGINTRTSMAVRLSPANDAESILAFVGDSTSEGIPSAVPAGRAAAAAIQLVNLPPGFPAVLAAPPTRHPPPSVPQLLTAATAT